MQAKVQHLSVRAVPLIRLSARTYSYELLLSFFFSTSRVPLTLLLLFLIVVVGGGNAEIGES